MILSATLTRDDVALVVDSITPLSVTIDAERGRTVTFSRASVELVDGVGVRVGGQARVIWDLGGLTLPIDVNAWQLLVHLRVSPRRVLAFDPVLEVLDLKRCPALLDAKIADLIDRSLAKARDRLVWDFGRALSRRLWLPPRVEPGRAIDLVVTDGACSVTETEVRCWVEMRPRVQTNASRTRAAVGAVLDPQG